MTTHSLDISICNCKSSMICRWSFPQPDGDLMSKALNLKVILLFPGATMKTKQLMNFMVSSGLLSNKRPLQNVMVEKLIHDRWNIVIEKVINDDCGM